jgi:hypothetical protein
MPINTSEIARVLENRTGALDKAIKRQNSFPETQFDYEVLDSLDMKISSVIGKARAGNIQNYEKEYFQIKNDQNSQNVLEKYRRRANNFIPLQKWDGEIIGFTDKEVTAILKDKTDPEGIPEQVVFDIEEISVNDRAFLHNGAIFYWQIGYLDYAYSNRQRVSEIIFRRFPKYSYSDIEKIKKDEFSTKLIFE